MMTLRRFRANKVAATFLFLAATLLLLLLMSAARRGLGPSTVPSGGTGRDGQRTSQTTSGGGGGENESGVPATKMGSSALDALEIQAAKKRRSSVPQGLDLLLSGSRSFTSSELLASLRMPDHPTRATIEAAIREQLRSFYQTRGYVDVAVDVTASDSPPWRVHADVEEGAVYTLAAVETQGGGSVFAAGEIRAGYPDSGAVVDWPRLRRADSNLAERYRDAGYLDAKVSAKAIKSSARNQFRYKITIEEGRIYRIRSIHMPSSFASLSPFHEGEAFHPSLLASFLALSGLSKSNVVVDQFPADAAVDITVSGTDPAP